MIGREPFVEEAEMLDKSKMVGFVPTTDFEAAREFYVGKLGLRL